MMKTVTLKNGETLAYREQGWGDKTFVIIHGNMSSSAHLDIFMEHMAKEDYRIIAPDMRGFGESSYHNPIDSLYDFAKDIMELIDLLEIKYFILGGWSTGGGVAMEIAADWPERVMKLVLVESVGVAGYPMFKKDELGQPIVGAFLTTKEDIAKDAVQVVPITTAYASKNTALLKAIWDAAIYTSKKPEAKRYEKYLEDMLTQRNLVDVDYALVHFNISNYSNGVCHGNNRIQKIQGKTLVIQGNNDYVVPKTMGESIMECLGDRAELYSGDWGHSPFVDVPEELMAKIKDFISH